MGGKSLNVYRRSRLMIPFATDTGKAEHLLEQMDEAPASRSQEFALFLKCPQRKKSFVSFLTS